MNACIFCQIIRGEAPAEIIFSDDWVIVFEDINPTAPVHMLIVPKKHFTTLNDITPDDQFLLGHMLFVAQQIAQQKQIDARGFRLVLNTNHEGGQGVYHIHLHLLGGRKLSASLG